MNPLILADRVSLQSNMKIQVPKFFLFFLNFKCLGDKLLMAFHKRVEHNPEQCLRYGGAPLTLKKDTTSDCCQNCRLPLIFEFQLMPALIYLLGQAAPNKPEISINFGIVMFFTCPKNCQKNQPYHEEVLVLQEL